MDINLITIQHKDILPTILTGVYYASMKRVYKKPNLIGPYKNLMAHYGYNNVPVFCCMEERYCPMNVEKDNMLLLELTVPSNFVQYQSFYDWSDYIYFSENPYELLDGSEQNSEEITFLFDDCDKDDNTIKQKLDEIRNIAFRPYSEISLRSELQCTIPYIKKEWLKSFIPLLHLTEEEFLELTISGYCFNDLKHKDVYVLNRHNIQLNNCM